MYIYYINMLFKNKYIIVSIIVISVVILVWLLSLYLMILSKKADEKYNNEKKWFLKPMDMSSTKIIDNSDLPNDISDTIYSLGFWFYLDKWDNIDNNILSKKEGICSQPRIYLSKENNDLIVSLNRGATSCKQEQIVINDIPIKRWVYFYMNVKKRIVNIYLNKQLVESKVMETDIKKNSGNINIGESSLSGLLTSLSISNNIKKYDDIKAIYNKGPYNYNLLEELKNLFQKLLDKLLKMFDVCNR